MTLTEYWAALRQDLNATQTQYASDLSKPEATLLSALLSETIRICVVGESLETFGLFSLLSAKREGQRITDWNAWLKRTLGDKDLNQPPHLVVCFLEKYLVHLEKYKSGLVRTSSKLIRPFEDEHIRTSQEDYDLYSGYLAFWREKCPPIKAATRHDWQACVEGTCPFLLSFKIQVAAATSTPQPTARTTYGH